jgi:peptidoglycan hydrolase-like protein with peptidoglycan-binding domain
MTKYGAIIPTCFLLASGCALFDNWKMASESPPASVAVIENEAVAPEPAISTAEPKLVEMPTVPTRTLTDNDVRRLQTLLREFGFNPGPVDGMAGTRTKAAYIRLQSGCSKVGPLLDNLSLSVPKASLGQASEYKLPSREETRSIQGQLRSAGFDPGPVDGIFGSRTKTMVKQLQSGCLMAKEFEGLLTENSSRTAKNEPALPVQSEATMPAYAEQAPIAPARNETISPVAANTHSRSQEDIRILQLRLRDAGFDPGPFDGVMGPKTRSALERYEASQRGRKIKASLTSTNIHGQY